MRQMVKIDDLRMNDTHNPFDLYIFTTPWQSFGFHITNTAAPLYNHTTTYDPQTQPLSFRRLEFYISPKDFASPDLFV